MEKIEEIGPQSRYTRYPMNPSRLKGTTRYARRFTIFHQPREKYDEIAAKKWLRKAEMMTLMLMFTMNLRVVT